MRCPCGSEWWVEQRVIRPAAAAALNPHATTTPAEITYRLLCADCGAKPGELKLKTTPRRRKQHG